MKSVTEWKQDALKLSNLRKEVEASDRWLQENVFSAPALGLPEMREEDQVDLLDRYMAECARCVATKSSIDHDSALDHIFRLAEAGEREGALPPLPGVDASAEEIQEWLDAAQSTEFVDQAIATAIEFKS